MRSTSHEAIAPLSSLPQVSCVVAASRQATFVVQPTSPLGEWKMDIPLDNTFCLMQRNFDLSKSAYLITEYQATVLQSALGFLRALIAALQPHSPVAPRGRIIVEPKETRHCPRLSPADSVLIILGLSLQCHFCVQLSLETPNLSFYSVFGLHARLYKSDQRTLRRRRALRRLVKSPAKAKLRPTAADQLGILCQPAQGAHRCCILDDTPVGSASVVRTIHAPPPMLPSTLASQPCCKAQQQGLGFLSMHPCYCPGSLACSAVDFSIQRYASGPTSLLLLLVLEPRSACRIDFELITKTWYLWSDVAN